MPGFTFGSPTGKAIDTRPELAWEHTAAQVRQGRWQWLAELVEVPEDAAPPLYMSPPPDDAVCSYGWSECTHLGEALDARAWVERELGITLRWWQALAIARDMEHRADGSLCHSDVLESGPRRIGKSVRMRSKTLWRMERRDLFGETQTVVHTGSDMAICREIQRQAWRWAEARWGKDAVTKANGKEAIETLLGDRWLVRSQDAVYGYDVTLALVDEAWDVKPETVDEGLEPATLERIWPQVHLTSTAHRRATSLMRGRLATALSVAAPGVLVLIWGAPPGSDVGDRKVWRAASPHWSEHRARLMETKYEKALAGQVDPQADDPDPLAGFAAQYLNVWRLTERPLAKGDPVTDPDTWGELVAYPGGQGDPVHVAVESWFAAGVTVARAWRVGDRVVVTAADYPTVDAAAAAAKATGVRRVTVGKSLAEHPAFKANGLRAVPATMRVADAVTELGALLREDALRHDGSEHLSGQLLELRTTRGADGPRVVGGNRADAVKAVVMAAKAARKPAGGGRIGIVVGSTARA